MAPEENKALVRRFVEEVQNQHNLEALDDLLSPDFVDYSGMSQPPTREGTRALFTMMFAAFPDMRFTIEQQLAEVDRVMTYKIFHGTQKGPFMGIPPTGKKVTFEVVDIFTISNGQLAEHWTVGNMLSLMQQLGAVPAPA